MARKTRETIVNELTALNQTIKNPVDFSEDDEYETLCEKLKQAQAQVEPEKPAEENKPEAKPAIAFLPVEMGKGNDQYGAAIRQLQKMVAELASK